MQDDSASVFRPILKARLDPRKRDLQIAASKQKSFVELANRSLRIAVASGCPSGRDFADRRVIANDLKLVLLAQPMDDRLHHRSHRRQIAACCRRSDQRQRISSMLAGAFWSLLILKLCRKIQLPLVGR